PGVAVHLVLRPLEHVGREVDPGHLAVRGIRVERESGPHPQLEHARPRLDRERADDPGDARIEHAPEEQVVEVRELVVEPAFVRLRVRQSHTSPLVSSATRTPANVRDAPAPYRERLLPGAAPFMRRWSLAAAA